MTYTQFEEAPIFPGLSQILHDGTPIVGLITDGLNPPAPIRTWTLAVRLTATALVALRTFYENHIGPATPFYWYNPEEGTPVGSNYDATGISVTGRHTVKFANPEWLENTTLGRSNSPFSLIEVDD